MSPVSEIVSCSSTLDSDKITSILTAFFFFLIYSEFRSIALRFLQTSKGFGFFFVPSIIIVKAGLIKFTV